MGRNNFEYKKEVLIDNIFLDHENPRIRSADGEPECIARLLRKEEQMRNLIESIASEGLSTMPIIISPSLEEKGKWIVRDGNRRIAALKLLKNPEKCPDEHLRLKIKAIKYANRDNIIASVDCLSSDNEDAIVSEMLARHLGEMGGIGQVTWSAYLRTVYILNNKGNTTRKKLPVDYKRAGQYLLWAEGQGIFIEDNFPITNVDRFFNSENVALLGLRIDNDKLVPTLSEDKVRNMASKVISDFAAGKNVSDVFTDKLAKAYIAEVRKTVGIIDDAAPKTESQNDTGNGQDQAGTNSQQQNANTETKKDKNTTGTEKPPSRPPSKPSWDRKKLFHTGSSAPTIPLTEVKARTIVYEINKQANISETPLAVSMLLRALIEISDAYYRNRHQIKDKGKLALNIESSCDSMLKKNSMSQSQVQLLKAYTKTNKDEVGIFNIDTLQKYLHRDTHHPTYQVLNTFWDEIGCFVRACWTSK